MKCSAQKGIFYDGQVYDAFIINTEKRDEILSNYQTEAERARTAELIRPFFAIIKIKVLSLHLVRLCLACQREKIYRQLANHKTKNMKQTDFSATAILQKDGKIANLIYPNNYPWTVCQAIDIHDDKELESYRLYFSKKYLSMYFAKNGDRSFFVVQTSGCTPGKRLDINQANHAQVYKDIQNCLQAAADWWSEYKDSGQQVALSL